MIKIDIDNSMCRVTGLSTKQFNELRKLMSYKVDPQAAYFSQDHSGGVKYLLGKRGDFASGLLYLVKGYLKHGNVAYAMEDHRKRPISQPGLFKLNLGVRPYKAQLDAVAAAVKAGRAAISMPTGTGKSLTMALLVNTLQVRVLVVVPNVELKKQLVETFRQLFGSLENITVENIGSPSLKTATNYDCLIIDESHHVAARTYRGLNKKQWRGIFYRFFFSATQFRSMDEETMLMQSVSGPVVYRLSYKTAVEQGLICPVEAYYYELPKREVEGYTWPQVYKELVVDNKERNALIISLLHQLVDVGASTLCLVKEIAHGENLIRGTKLKFIKGENDDNREKILEFNLMENRLLVATTGVMGEGIDTKPCEYVLITGLGKSKNAFMQQCGRGVRKYPGKESCKVIIFKDKSHKWTLAHYNAQAKILREEYGVVPEKLE